MRDASEYTEAIRRIFNYTPTKAELEHHAVRMRVGILRDAAAAKSAKLPSAVSARIGFHFSDAAAGDAQDFCLPMEKVKLRQPLFFYTCPDKLTSQQWYRSILNGDESFSW